MSPLGISSYLTPVKSLWPHFQLGADHSFAEDSDLFTVRPNKAGKIHKDNFPHQVAAARAASEVREEATAFQLEGQTSSLC